MEKGEPIRKYFLNRYCTEKFFSVTVLCSNSKQMGSGFLMRLLFTAGLGGGAAAQG